MSVLGGKRTVAQKDFRVLPKRQPLSRREIQLSDNRFEAGFLPEGREPRIDANRPDPGVARRVPALECRQRRIQFAPLCVNVRNLPASCVSVEVVQAPQESRARVSRQAFEQPPLRRETGL